MNMEQLLICLSLALIAGLLMSRLAKVAHLPAVTSYLVAGLLLDGSAEAQTKKADLWKYLKENTKPDVYRAVRYGFGGITNLNFPKGDAIVVGVYRIAQKIFKFN